MAGVANFAILHRDDRRNLTEYQPNSNEYTFVASTINLCQQYLSTPQARHALALLAIEFDRTNGNRWYTPLNEDMNRASFMVTNFLTKIRQAFPFVVVDDLIRTPDILAAHPRGQWDGEFYARAQAVNINSSRLRDMISAANQGDSTNFRTFQFQLAHAFIHEVGGHILITYLGRGRRPGTPPRMGHAHYPGPEAGRRFEILLLEGSLEYYRDRNQTNQEPGTPHLLSEENTAQRISRTTIENFVRYRFEFPYTMSGPEIDMNRLRPMGAGAIVQDAPHGPNSMAQALSRGYNVRLSDVCRIPTDPRIRLRIAA